MHQHFNECDGALSESELALNRVCRVWATQHNGELRLAWHALYSVQCSPVQSTVRLPANGTTIISIWLSKEVCAWNVPSSFISCSSFSLFSALDTLFGVLGQRRRALCGHHSRLGCVYCAICLSAFAFMDNDDHYAMSMPMPMSRWGCWWWGCLRKNLRPVSLMYECASGVGL